MCVERREASIPLIFRRFILNTYDPSVMVLIDRAGAFHDKLTGKYPRSTTHNRKRFSKLLKKFNTPTELRVLIIAGLWVYDHSPEWLAKKLKNTTHD